MSVLSWPWSDGASMGGSMRMHVPTHLPVLNLTEMDVRRGAVKVIARSPSGRTQTIKVGSDSSGQFMTNFTPNEVGDWMINIMYENENIDGSPFTVRVYDPGRVKVFGLQDGGDTGGPIQFTVDTTEAGDGEVVVDVTYDGRQMATRIDRKGQLHHISFMPEGPGVYNIEVQFQDREVTGSPFTVEIASPAVVTLYGDGLEAGERGQKTIFMIDTGVPTDIQDINVLVSPPRGARLPVDIIKMADTCFRVEFIPNIVGDHILDVTVRDRCVDGSPFVTKVYDSDQIVIGSIPTQTILGKPVCFGIDATESGSGKLEIIINDGAVPCQIENSGAKKFLATFVPEEPVVHVVRVLFNNTEVAGSPWRIEVLSADGVRTNADELGMLMVNQPASFEIYTDREAEASLSVSITGPDCCPLQTTITRKCACCYEVQFTPRRIGMYQILVTYEGMLVDGSPYTFCVFDPSAVRVCPVDPVACNELVEFTVDANNAGSGELSIVVNNGSVPSSARMISQNVYAVSFMPYEPGIHTVELYFNCVPLKDSPLMISVVDARLITFSGPTLVPVRKLASLKANTEAAGKANLIATMTSPTEKDVPVRVVDADPIGFHLDFTPLEVGPHKLRIIYGEQCPVVEPLTIMAYDACCIKVMGVKDGLVGCRPSKFTVDLNKCGEGELDVSIVSSSGDPVCSEVRLIEAGRLEVVYSPEEAGMHFAEVMFNSEPVNGSPFQFNVLDPGKVIVRGSGLDLVPVNEPTTFMIVAPSAQMQDIDVIITGPTGRQILPNVTEKRVNNFLVEYTPKQAGLHMVNVRYFDCEVPESPFSVQVWDASQVRVANVTECGECGVEAFFNIELSDAGDGTVEIVITGPNCQLIPHQIVTVEPSLLEVHYTPTMPGVYNATVTYNGVCVPGSPVQFKVIDVNKVIVRGDGLGLVPVNRPATFTITAPDAKLSEIDVAITNPAGVELIPKITETCRGNFRVEYVPCTVGCYQIRIAYCCIEVSPSAFIAKAWDASRVLLADVCMGEVGVESSFKVIMPDAGEGVVEITLSDPVGHLLPNQVVTAEPGVLEVIYTPTVAGMHRANVVFNCETVPASPFSFLVIDVSCVSCWGDGLCPVPVCKPVSFYITAPQASAKDITARIVGPNGRDVPTHITETSAGSFRVEYTPVMAGEHFVTAFYFGRPISCCPETVQVWDISKVLVSPIPMGFVCVQSVFTVDAIEAGEGKLDIAIIDPNGQPLTSEVATDGQGAYCISYIPTVAGQHHVDVYFNRMSVAGSPFSFFVADPEKVHACGDGLDMVRAGKLATFIIAAPAGRLCDFSVKIFGPNDKPVNHRLYESGPGEFTVEYLPALTGNYLIDISYFDEPIKDNPFTARAWDPAGVIVYNIKPGIVCEESFFNINAMGAGSGNLEVTVTCRGEEVPSTVTTGLHASDITVSFVPKSDETHLVNVYFNGQTVPGSPFAVPILNGQLARACGPGLQRAVSHMPATFNIDTCGAGGDADTPINVQILSPCGREIEPVIYQTATTGYSVTYTPEEPGCYTIHVLYANTPICGSPFCVEVFDPCAVHFVGHMPQCFVVGQPATFKVDSCEAGNGHVAAQVKAPTTHPPVMITESDGLSALSFVPLETGEHLFFVTFGDVNIPGSPLTCDVIDPKCLRVNYDAFQLRRVGDVVQVEVTTDGSSIDGQLSCTVTDPFQRDLAVEYVGKPKRHLFSFVAQDVGPHLIDLRCDCDTVVGGPFTCNVYDAERVRILDVTECADIGDEVEFTVDSSEAGFGDVDVSVTQGGVGVPVKRNQVAVDIARYSFTTKLPKQHIIHVTFNGQNVPGSPLYVQVVNPANKMSLHYGNATTSVPVTQTVWATVNLAGYSCYISPEAIIPTVVAPSSDLIPAKVSQLTNGGVRVEYCSSFVGNHELSVEYGGQMIPGSPLCTEIFDPSKILLEGIKRCKVGEQLVVDVCLVGAGEAELCITVIDPSGQTMAFDVEPTPTGQRVTYIPECPGTYKVNATYGGCNVPGCPIRQEAEPCTKATASGCGLDFGIVDRMAEFVVDVKGECGDLFVDVRGPRSRAHTVIEPESGRNWKVKYMPAEVGVFTIELAWNDIEVYGSPFHPKIIDPSKVEVADKQIENWTAADRLTIYVDELYDLVFDCGGAGPGALRATITGPKGDLQDFDLLPFNTDADNNSDMFVMKFLPRCQGDYYIRAYWCDIPIQLFPIIATATVPEPEVNECEVRPELVSVSGPGISFAYCHENADFVIDGHEAGPGVHDVKMVGLKCDVDVMCVPIEEGVFGCTYVPEVAGAYLLTVLWSGQHVHGSPFKISVMSTSDASKVVCSGDGLTNIVLGREGSVLVDTRTAGPGELVAQCAGPNQAAYSTLIDRHDGTYELIIRPQEPGIHKLQVTYGCEPVPGSPFCIKVTAPPNASMVKVSGDGIKCGLLATYQSTFVVDTRGAGPGQLTVKVRGRKGAFRVEMSRLPGNDRMIQCRYYPMEIGVYDVYVLWSGEHVPGSPFRVNIVDTMEQLRTLAEQLEIAVDPNKLDYGTTSSRSSASSRGGSTLRGLMFTDDY